MARWRTANYSRYHQLLRSLARIGHQVFVLEPPALDWLETNYLEVDVEIPPGVDVREVTLPQWLWNSSPPMEKIFKKGIYSLVARKHVRRVISEFQIDVLILYNLPQLFMQFDSPCFTVFDVADDLLAMLGHEVGSTLSPATMGLGDMVLRKMLSHSHLAVVVSRTLQKRIKHPTLLLPNGADPREIAESQRIDLPVRTKRPIIGYLGCFEYFVDFDMVLRSASMLSHVDFWLVGSGRDFTKIEARVKQEGLENVWLPGPVDHKHGLAMMSKADICILPRAFGRVSDAACPIKLFEYAALGKPVVCTPVAEVQKIAEGFAFFVRDHLELTATITKLLEDPLLTEGRTRYGLELIERTYNWGLIAEEFVNTVERMMGGGSL